MASEKEVTGRSVGEGKKKGFPKNAKDEDTNFEGLMAVREKNLITSFREDLPKTQKRTTENGKGAPKPGSR